MAIKQGKIIYMHKEQKPSLHIGRKIAIFFSTIILIIVAIFLIIGFFVSRPQNFAKQFFNVAAIGDYRRLYDYMDISENDNIGREEYIKLCEEYITKNDIKPSAIKEVSIKKIDKLGYEAFFVTYDNPEISQKYTFKLQKADKKQWLFFSTYLAQSKINL